MKPHATPTPDAARIDALLADLQRQLSPAPPDERRMLPLQAVQPGPRASGEVLVTGNRTHNMLRLDDLPSLPPHRTYRLRATAVSVSVESDPAGAVPKRPVVLTCSI